MRLSRRLVLAVSLAALLCLPVLGAEQFVGKVVGISGGDTLSVMREGKAVKVAPLQVLRRAPGFSHRERRRLALQANHFFLLGKRNRKE